MCDSVLTDGLPSFEVQRFTRHQHNRGDTTGWRFAAGWFLRDSGLQWAWFSREPEEKEHASNERSD